MKFIQKLIVNITLYCDDASFKKKILHSQDRANNIGLVTSMAFSLCCWPKPKIQCSSSFGCTPIFKRLFLHAHVGHFLWESFRICNYSRSSTSIALRIGSVAMSLQISSFSSIINTFSALRVGKRKISQSPQPRKCGCGLWNLCSDNQGSDNWGCSVLYRLRYKIVLIYQPIK